MGSRCKKACFLPVLSEADIYYLETAYRRAVKIKDNIIRDFKEHVSSGKVDFFARYGMEFILGEREGIFLRDISNAHELINLHCNGGVFNLGHRHPQIIQTLTEALQTLDIGNHHLLSYARARAAKQLSALMPGDLNYTIFGVSGGEATDTAVKIARSYTGRSKIISIRGGYHGHTGYALSTGDDKYRAPFGPRLPGFEQCDFGQINSLKSVLDEDTAAFIIETIPATLGMPIPEYTYLQEVWTLCKQHGILLILDEVQCGLGRTGKLWAFEHYDLLPDIVILGKGLSGGIYPISATVIRSPLERVFHADPFIHVSTFGGAELGCMVMSKVLDISSQPAFLEHVQAMAELFENGIKNLQKKHSAILSGLRQKGLMMGLELSDELSGPLLTKTAYDAGLLMIYANNDKSVCQLLPPLIITPGEVDLVLTKLDKALAKAKVLRPLLKARKLITGLNPFVKK